MASSAPEKPFRVAIIGGGLGGVALATGLKRRNIPFTIFESRASFTEIGAGISLSPSAVSSLGLLDPFLGEAVYKLATRNPSPTLYMNLRYGAPSGDHADGELIGALHSPPTGNMSLLRQELLTLLAGRLDEEQAQFNKKLDSYEQTDESVTLKFADGSEESASLLVGCDGIHSRTRSIMLGEDNILSRPHFNGDGVYRAVLPVEKAVEAIGESARESQILLGPNGYLILYPVHGGKTVNCGGWFSKKGMSWDHDAWLLPNQGESFAKDCKGWGDRARKIFSLFEPDPPFWSAHQHVHQPDHFYDGRVLLIGDCAHSMPPHQGAGAGQAVEDAFVLAEILTYALQNGPTSDVIDATLRAYEDVRKPRFLQVQRFSSEATWRWEEFYDQKLEGHARDEWYRITKERFEWIWNVDMLGEAERARLRVHELLHGTKEIST